MRMMLRWTVPVEKGNTMVGDGSMQTVVEAVIARTNPEAAYFLAEDGMRAGMVFFELAEASDIPGIAEILFREANAAVELIPVMNGDDLKKALSSLGAVHG
jgi:hypothetical protein